MANCLLFRSLTATFNDAKLVRCSVLAKSEIEKATMAERALGASKIEPNVLLPVTPLGTSLERLRELRGTHPLISFTYFIKTCTSKKLRFSVLHSTGCIGQFPQLTGPSLKIINHPSNEDVPEMTHCL